MSKKKNEARMSIADYDLLRHVCEAMDAMVVSQCDGARAVVKEFKGNVKELHRANRPDARTAVRITCDDCARTLLAAALAGKLPLSRLHGNEFFVLLTPQIEAVIGQDGVAIGRIGQFITGQLDLIRAMFRDCEAEKVPEALLRSRGPKTTSQGWRE